MNSQNERSRRRSTRTRTILIDPKEIFGDESLKIIKDPIKPVCSQNNFEIADQSYISMENTSHKSSFDKNIDNDNKFNNFSSKVMFYQTFNHNYSKDYIEPPKINNLKDTELFEKNPSKIENPGINAHKSINDLKQRTFEFQELMTAFKLLEKRENQDYAHRILKRFKMNDERDNYNEENAMEMLEIEKSLCSKIQNNPYLINQQKSDSETFPSSNITKQTSTSQRRNKRVTFSDNK